MPQTAREKAIMTHLKTIEKVTINKTLPSNQREQSIIALKNRDGINVRDQGNTDGDILTRIRRLMKELKRETKPFPFAYKGKTYLTDIDEVRKVITVTERHQDSNNEWHNGKTVTLKGNEADSIARRGGGYFTDKIVGQLGKEGKLPNASN